jgi:hypothetical protein
MRQAGVSATTATGAPLLMRGREVESLEAVVEAAAAGDGRFAIVERPAGSASSRLLAEARRRGA